MHILDMVNVSEIINSLGGNAAVALRLDVGPSTVSEMKRRNAIPVKYWPRIIAMASEKAVDDVTSETLMQMHAETAE